MWVSLRFYGTLNSPLSAKALYKKLLRDCRKLPKDAQPYYTNFVRQGFGQHAEETDPERIKQIVDRAVEDAKWILNKVCQDDCQLFPTFLAPWLPSAQQ